MTSTPATPHPGPPRHPAQLGSPPRVGIIGAGQLARMCAAPANELGIALRVLSESAEASAAQVISDSPVGSHTDLEAVRTFAQGCQVVTFDHEHVPTEILDALIAQGVSVQPGPHALRFAQDKLAMRERLTELGLPCPAWAAIRTADELTAFGAKYGWPAVLKTPCGGYDGKGVLLVSSAAQASDWLARAQAADEPLLVEAKVPFVRELAALIARSPGGEIAAWPIVETVQEEGVCAQVVAPAQELSSATAEQAASIAHSVATELDVTGVMAVELFQLADGSVLVNELAMRPHNSGHWSQDGAITGQFEQHLRAVLDLPLGDPSPRAPWTVMANVLGADQATTAGSGDLYVGLAAALAADPGAKMHLYGKDARPGRKLGHVNVVGDDVTQVRERAIEAARRVQGGSQ